MSSQTVALAKPAHNHRSGALLVGTGLAFASLILVPAVAASIGLGPSLTGALRMALMKASNRAIVSSAAKHRPSPAPTLRG